MIVKDYSIKEIRLPAISAVPGVSLRILSVSVIVVANIWMT